MFKVGQKVVCVNSFWQEVRDKKILGIKYGSKKVNTTGPKDGEICLIVGIRSYNGYLFLDGYGNGPFQPEGFRPLDYDFVEEVIKQVQPEKQPA